MDELSMSSSSCITPKALPPSSPSWVKRLSPHSLEDSGVKGFKRPGDSSLSISLGWNLVIERAYFLCDV
jgi:hypothetical protein